MAHPEDQSYHKYALWRAFQPSRDVSAIMVAACLAITVAVLLGWIFQVELLISLRPEWPATVPATAVGLSMGAMSLWLQGRKPLERCRSGIALAYAALGLGAAMSVFCIWGWAPPPFRIYSSDSETVLSLSSPITAAMLVAIGASLALITSEKTTGIAQSVAVGVLLATLLVLLGYLARGTFVSPLLPGYGTSVLTTVAFMLLSIGVLSLRSSGGLTMPIIGSTPTARVSRRLLMLTLATPLVLGVASIIGAELGLYSAEEGTALLVWGLVTLFAVEVLRLAHQLYQSDVARDRAADELRQSEQKFRMLYENAPIGIAHINLDGQWTYANRKFAEITGYAPEEVAGLSYLDVTPVEERAISRDFTEKLLAGEIQINRERRMLRKDGSTTWIRLTASMLRDESGRPQYGIGIFEDIDERKKAEAALRESEERFRTIFENAPVGIAEAALDGAFLNANPKLLELLGYTLDEFRKLSVTNTVHPAHLEKTRSDFQDLISGKVRSYIAEKRYLRKDGSLVWMNVTTALRLVDGVPRYTIAILEDATARKKAEEDLRRALEHSYHLATHDALTGLANRASFNDRLQDAVSYAKRDGHIVALHLLDLDRFKLINDTFGHHVGDLLLKEVAHRVKAQTRSTDVVARLGGDEFVIIQTHLADPSAAGVLAEKIMGEIGRVFLLEGKEVRSGTSIGIALFPDDSDDAVRLVKLADLALYEAKRMGRHNIQFYQHEMGAAVEEALKLEQDLRQALGKGEFGLCYQPQFDLKKGRISGIEALIRWQHPERGAMNASEFIRHAENAGLMPSIGEWMLRTACRQHRQWVRAGLEAPLILNVSLRQLRYPGFLEMLRGILEETGLSPSRVLLEMSEAVLWDPKLPAGLLEQAKEAGIQLGLDDFGREFAALSSLHRFPLDVVKPGRSLVKALPDGDREAAILEAVVSVAHGMRISVCAEGVETAEQLAAVEKHGCDSAQGFLLSSPVGAEEVGRLVEAEQSRH